MSPFTFTQNGLRTLWTFGLMRLLARVSRRAPPLFLPVNNEPALEPVLVGEYEADLCALIRHLADCGYKDALFDIGANIGLTAFFNYRHFSKTYCYEPNPRAFHVLCANLFHAPADMVTLFPFGLGAEDKQELLQVPKNNIGGAFVADSINSLNQEELARKDGYATFSEANYHTVPISIKQGRAALRDVLPSIGGSYVFKIDVEGYEEAVLKEVAAVLPRTAAAAIIFENWNEHDFDIDRVLGYFGRPVSRARLANTTNDAPNRVVKILRTVLLGRTYYLSKSPDRWLGHVVLELPACNSP
jgi:FkbM family methyltransferase